MSDFLKQLIAIIQQFIEKYDAGVLRTGQRNAEMERTKALYVQIQQIVMPLLSDGAKKTPEIADAAMKQALVLANDVVGRLARYAAAQAADYLEQKELDPALAAMSGSNVYEALKALMAVIADQKQWLSKRFERPLMSTIMRKPYRYVGPVDVDYKLAALARALEMVEANAERAKRDLALASHPLRYFLPDIPGATELNPAPRVRVPDVTGPNPSIKLTASRDAMERLRREYLQFVDFVSEQVTDIMDDLREATRPGGGIDPRTVKMAIGAALYICTLGRMVIQSQRDLVALIGTKTVIVEP